MSDLMLLSEAQMRQIEPFFPLSHGVPRVDDRLVLSDIISSCATACGGATCRKKQASASLLGRLGWNRQAICRFGEIRVYHSADADDAPARCVQLIGTDASVLAVRLSK